MTTKFYADESGALIGGFGDGAEPPEGAVEVSEPPSGLWIWNGAEWHLPLLSPAELIETYRRAVQAHVDATAQSKGYNNGAAMAGYVSSTIPTWRAEAEAFVAWRDQVWLFVFETLAQIEAENMEAPESATALVATIPEIEW
jgi:hypothetical protein